MIVDYSHHVSLARAVAQTLDGEHPCDLCKHIVAAQHSQKKQDTVAATLKPDLICATGSIVLVPFYSDFCFAKFQMTVFAQADSPPVPPPRSELV